MFLQFGDGFFGLFYLVLNGVFKLFCSRALFFLKGIVCVLSVHESHHDDVSVDPFCAVFGLGAIFSDRWCLVFHV